MEKLIFLGSGSGLCSPQENFHSNVLVVSDQGLLLAIDCGSHFQLALEMAEISIEDIDSYFITHLHADHIGGLEWVALKRYFGPNGIFKVGKEHYHGPRLISNTEILDDLWSHSLSGGLETLQGKRNTLETFFRVDPLPPNGTFAWCGIVFDIIQTVHTMDNRRVKPSYGLMFRLGGKKIFFTGDTQFCPNQIMAFYEEADLIFQDCELAKYPQSVHAQWHEICSFPESVRRKMHPYHYSGPLPEDWQDRGFLPFVQRGQIFEF